MTIAIQSNDVAGLFEFGANTRVKTGKFLAVHSALEGEPDPMRSLALKRFKLEGFKECHSRRRYTQLAESQALCPSVRMTDILI